MPQVGWRDPSTGEEKPFSYWLAEAGAWGTALGYPYEILFGMYEQLSGKDRPSGITVTQLNGCARAVHLEQLVEYYADPAKNYPAFRGTLVHSLLEKYAPEWVRVEERYYRTYKDVAISGQLDRWHVAGPDGPSLTDQWHWWLQSGADPDTQPVLGEDNRIVIDDYKSKHELPTYTYVANAYQQQGNLYRWLLRVPPGKADINFIFVSMEGVRIMSLYDGGKFKNGRSKPEQIWSDRKVEAFLDDRLLTLAASIYVNRPIPYDKVPDDDLWQCGFCPAINLCHRLAAEEARQSWSKGERYDRLPPRVRE